jgi:protoheme ferro-lyase
MALSEKTIQNLSIALTPDVIDDIFQDERYIELMMELIPEFVAKSLQSKDIDLVVDIGSCIMDNIAMKPHRTV